MGQQYAWLKEAAAFADARSDTLLSVRVVLDDRGPIVRVVSYGDGRTGKSYVDRAMTWKEFEAHAVNPLFAMMDQAVRRAQARQEA